MKIFDWAVSIGLIPGILFGIRSYVDPNIYDTQTGEKVSHAEHVIYFLCLDLTIDTWVVVEENSA